MAFGTYGSKTNGRNSIRTVEIAKLIREDIKRAQSLPTTDAMWLPKDLKVSVKVPHHGSIRVGITASPSVLICNPARVAFDASSSGVDSVTQSRYLPRYTREGERILFVLDRIASQWHWDESDSMTDYFFCAYYLSVELHWEARAAFELQALSVIEAERKDLEVALASGQSILPALEAISQQYAYKTSTEGEMELKARFAKYDAEPTETPDTLAALRAEIEEQRELNAQLRAKLERRVA